MAIDAEFDEKSRGWTGRRKARWANRGQGQAPLARVNAEISAENHAWLTAYRQHHGLKLGEALDRILDRRRDHKNVQAVHREQAENMA